MSLQDSQGRRHRKLRVSLTDRCNFRCPYCMPEKPRWMPASQLLDADALLAICRVFVEDLGIRALRLTGGEPLLRKDLVDIVKRVNALRAVGLERLSMTSNGVRLAALAATLARAGLQDVNISLDSLDQAEFQRLSRGRYGLADVLTGIQAAQDAGLGVKLNCVIIRGYNDDQVLPLVHWAHSHGLELRFIEFMPLDDEQLWTRERVISAQDILRQIEAELTVAALPEDGSPARRYRLANGQIIGIIATVTQPFCHNCDRLRITADGRLYTCLFGKEGTLLAPLAGQPDRLRESIRDAVLRKPPGYVAEPGYAEREVRMYHLGG